MTVITALPALGASAPSTDAVLTVRTVGGTATVGLSTPGVASGGIAAITGGTATLAAITMDGSLAIINVNSPVATVVTTPVPAGMTPWKAYTVKDAGGNATLFPITLAPPSGTIDGSASYIIAQAYDSVDFYTDAAQVNLYTK